MNNISIADILELPVQERIRLVELIWDSVAAVPEAVEVSPALKAELEARLAEFEATPEAGYFWDQVKARLKDGSWRTDIVPVAHETPSWKRRVAHPLVLDGGKISELILEERDK